MNSILRIVLIVTVIGPPFCGGLFASPGEFSELKLPSGISASAVKVTENFTLVGNTGASYAGKTGAGEVLVYSNATGKLLRRLRAKDPVAGGAFGRLITAEGQTAYVVEGSFRVHAVSIATGHIWWTTTTLSSPDDPLPGKSVQIGSVAVDGVRLYLGLPEAWLIDYPQLSNYLFEGMTVVINAWTGARITTFTSTQPEAFAQFGVSVAAGGGYYAIGAAAYDNESSGSPVSNQGMVVVGHVSGWRSRILSPIPGVNQAYGFSVAIAGFSLYVGTGNGNAVHHYDLRNLGLIQTINAPAGSTFFGNALSASGHLLVIGDGNGSWLYDRQAKTLVRIFEGAKALAGPVKAGLSLAGTLAAGPAQGRVFLSKGVGGGRFLGSRLIATTRTEASGLSPKKFASFGELAVTDTGVVAHTARLSGGVTSANDSGLWNTLSGSHDLVMRKGEAVGTKRAGAPFKPYFTPGGQGRYLARLNSGELGVWSDDGMNPTFPIMMEGTGIGIPGYGVTLPVRRIHEAVAPNGNVNLVNFTLKAGNGIQSTNDSFIARPGLLALVEAREGLSSGVNGITYGQLAPRIAAMGNRQAYSTALLNQPTSSNAAVFSKTLGAAMPIVLAQKNAPAHHLTNQFTDPKFTSFVGEAISPGGTVYRAKFSSGKTTREGLWLHNNQDGTALANTAAVAWVDGQPSGTGAGVTFRRFLKTFVTNSGDVVFMAQMKGPGITAANDLGIWRRNVSNGQVSLVIREGDVIPCSDGATVSSLQRLDVAGSGRWMVLASLKGGPSARNQVLLVGNMASYVVPEVLQRKGDVVDRSEPSRLLSLNLSTNNCDSAGMGSKGMAKLVGASHALYTATFPHGTELVSSTVFGN